MTSFALASFSCQFIQGFPRLAIMLEACLQMLVIAVLFQFRQNSFDRYLGVADQSVAALSATAEVFSPHVDLDSARWPRTTLLIMPTAPIHLHIAPHAH